MKWHVVVEGPGAVLHELAIVVSDSDIRLAAQRGRVILSASRLDSMDDVGNVRREAERIVAVMSGFARLLLRSTESLRVLDVVDAQANGDSERVSATASEGPAPDEGRPAGARVPWPQSTLFQSLRLALESPTMAEALRLRDADSLDWTVVTRICEVIEESAGGRSAVVRLSGVPSGVIWQLRDRTTVGANAHNVGERARAHVRARPLTLSEAASVLDRLLVTWLSSVTRRSQKSR
jgi:hypothetical protein